MHLAEPRSDSLELTDNEDADSIPVTIALEPSRSAVITGLYGVGFKIHDWACNRSVVISTTEDIAFVRVFRM